MNVPEHNKETTDSIVPTKGAHASFKDFPIEILKQRGLLIDKSLSMLKEIFLIK